jgi:hypothetical protein
MEKTIRASRAGEIAWRPKSTIAQPDGAFFLSSMACAPKSNIAVFHTVAGLPAGRSEPGKPHYYTYQLVTNYQTGIPIAMVDGTFTANMLPACDARYSAHAFWPVPAAASQLSSARAFKPTSIWRL